MLLTICSGFGNISFISSLIQIELKKSMAKYHTEYLLNLKFHQINTYSKSYDKFASFLEEKEIPLHQQV